MSVILTVPHISQTMQADCLAACAAMVLSYLDKPLPYDDLLALLRIQWFGAPFKNVLDLEQMGVHVL